MELEANMNEDGTDIYGEFTQVSAADILTKDIHELKLAVKEAKQRHAEDPLASTTGTKELPPTAITQTAAHDGELTCISLCEDTGALATAGIDCTIRIFENAEDNATVSTARCSLPLGGQPATLEWSPCGSLLACGTSQGLVHCYKPDGSLYCTLHGHTEGEPVLALAWAARSHCDDNDDEDNEMTTDGEVDDAAKQELIQEKLAKASAAKAATLLARCGPLATGGADSLVVVWNVHRGAAQQKWPLSAGAILDLDWRLGGGETDRTDLVAGTQAGSVVYLKVGEDDAVKVWTPTSIINGAVAAMTAVAAAEAGTANGNGTADDTHAQTMIPSISIGINSIRWDPTGHFIAAAGSDGVVRLWSPVSTSLKPEAELTGHKREVQCVRWGTMSGGRTALASASADGSVRIWDTSEQSGGGGCCSHVLDGHDGELMSFAWNPIGEYIACGDTNGKVGVWSVKTGGRVRSFEGPGCAYDVRWVGGGRVVVAACVGGTAALVAKLV
jgi:transducin (beta)-like 1